MSEPVGAKTVRAPIIDLSSTTPILGSPETWGSSAYLSRRMIPNSSRFKA
jgi:hypothetical protein